MYPRTAFATYSAPQVKAGASFVKTLHTHYIIQIIFSSRVMRMYVPGSCRINLMRTVYCHRPLTPARPATPPELRHRYLPPNAASNWANALAGRNVNPEAQPNGKAIPMNSTKASGSQNRQDSPLFLLGWSSSSLDFSEDFDSHRSSVVSMTSPVDQGGNSPGRRIPLSIKPQGMLNTHRIMS